MDEQSGVLSAENNKELVDRVRDEVRPVAKTMVNRIAMWANRYKDGARMTGAVACAVMERVVIQLAGKLHKDDRDAGEKFIETVYDASKQDAIAQWRQM